MKRSVIKQGKTGTCLLAAYCVANGMSEDEYRKLIPVYGKQHSVLREQYAALRRTAVPGASLFGHFVKLPSKPMPALPIDSFCKLDCGVLLGVWDYPTRVGTRTISHAVAVYRGLIYDSANDAPKKPLSWAQYRAYGKKCFGSQFIVAAYIDLTHTIYVDYTNTKAYLKEVRRLSK